jgi:hypothetical protein
MKQPVQEVAVQQDVTLIRVRVTVVAVEKHFVSDILGVCL